ncbi:MAG TPA: DUF885 family protein [Caulobacteraceae bacterium]|nr:DUF885 family protein [Caulobacteraceae bacterium]
MLNRRELIASAAAAAAAPRLAFAEQSEDAKLSALLDACLQEQLQNNPQQATLLGLDKGPNAAMRSRLNDTSPAGIVANEQLVASQLKRLEAISRDALSPDAQVDLDTLLYARRSAAAINAFGFGGASFGPTPYVVSQLSGSYQFTPRFLETKHPVESAADGEAYVERLAGFQAQLDGDTTRMRHHAALGVVAPDFILDLALQQMTALHQPPEMASVVLSFRRRLAAKGFDPKLGDAAAQMWQGRILPALDRQMNAARTLRARAGRAAGVGRLKDGPAYYAAALKAATTTSLTPAEVHQLGLDQGRQIAGRLDDLLGEQGLTRGTVGERIAALMRDPKSFFPDDDAGKAAAIAYCNDRLAAIRPRLPRWFKRLPPYRFEVRRVPANLEVGAAATFSEPPSLDGSRPGLVYFNLHDTHDWPKWALPTTVFHEGLPGHQLEGGLALANTRLPLIRKTIGFSGYAEGWALYAEQLADEIGMYDDDPLGRIGMLKMQLFRAGRCVADTGIHLRGWSRERAIAYFEGLEADAPGFAAREIERYCVNPGQACSYKIGHTVWEKARERARAALGPRFDIKDFHQAGLSCGRVPLEVLDGVIDRWFGSARA